MAILKPFATWRMPRGLKGFLQFCLVFLLLSVLPAVPAQAPSKEYQVKAVFLFNFAQFVEWPTNTFSDPNTPLVIGILGDDPFGNFLDETVQGEKVNNHPLVVQRYRSLEDVKACHVLFISRSEAAGLGQTLKTLKGRNILTVSDADNFTGQGGIIRFLTEKSKIRLRINLDAAKAENVIISSRLLKLADIVKPGKEE